MRLAYVTQFNLRAGKDLFVFEGGNQELPLKKKVIVFMMEDHICNQRFFHRQQ